MTRGFQSLYRAFKAIGIAPEGSAGPFVEDGVIVVWFGEERETKSGSTGLTVAMDNMRKRKEEFPPHGIPPELRRHQP